MSTATTPAGDTRYTIISADCHAGGSHEQYRGYLEQRYLDDFDAWRNQYKNPFRDLQKTDGGRVRNWDDERRNSDQERDGVVAEVVFPNTVPPFFPSFVLFARPPKPDEYEHRLAGIRAHNRWMADFCARFPERRAGLGQIFLNDVDEAIKDVRWIKEHNLRGGVLISAIPPDVDYVKPLYDPVYDPLWKLCEELEVPVTSHGGTGLPDYGKYPVASLLYITEVMFYSQRPFVQLLLSGVFERFPRLKFVMTEMGCAWLPPMLRHFDSLLEQIRATGRTGELAYSAEHVLPKTATEYFQQNCWVGVSQPGPADARARHEIGIDRFMWGSDYPHNEGTFPYTREHLRQLFSDTDPTELQQLLAGNAAALYDFDLDALAPLAANVGPTVAELAQPLDELPDDPNEALLKAAAGR
ncbi:MAG TPA: amidohydrolase family protein [Acidimicrobiia bacterium]|nr:amidohydrolase family protein [Acidimicrobiia bacterium]